LTPKTKKKEEEPKKKQSLFEEISKR